MVNAAFSQLRWTAGTQIYLAIALLAPFVAVLMFTDVLQPAPQRHERPALEAALGYIDTLPQDAPSFLFPDNQPHIEAVADGSAGRDALDALRAARPGRYRPARVGGAALQIVVMPGFLAKTENERKLMLTENGVSPGSAPLLAALPASHPPCSASLMQAHGWAQWGFVLVDPQAGAMSPETVRACVVAGFDYLLGVPVPAGQFDVRSFPDAAASLVLLDYVRQCAHAGETDRVPPVRSNKGITSLPSLSCIRAGIVGALDAYS